MRGVASGDRVFITPGKLMPSLCLILALALHQHGNIGKYPAPSLVVPATGAKIRGGVCLGRCGWQPL